MAVCRAPATRCPISSPFSPSLTSLFSTLFLHSPALFLHPPPSPVSFLFLPLLRHTRVVHILCQLKPPASLATLLSRFFPSVVPSRLNISISAFVALSLSLLHFSAFFTRLHPTLLLVLSLPPISRGCNFLCSVPESPPQSSVHVRVCRFIRQTRRKGRKGNESAFTTSRLDAAEFFFLCSPLALRF